MGRMINLTGQIFERLTVLGFDHCNGSNTFWRCKCQCGNETIVASWKLRTGRTKSCGCYKSEQLSERNYKHGNINTRAYQSWTNIKQRCYNITNQDYPNYGGRGITVDPAWMDSEFGFQNFFNDMGECPINHSIDRIDVNGNYCKNNCKWATSIEQARNQRSNKIKNIDQANQIRDDRKNGKSIKQLALDNDCSESCIQKIIYNQTWI